MLDLLRDLLVIVQVIAGYPLDAELPTAHVVADAELQQMACGKPCWVKALYDSERGIFLSQSLDVEHDIYARSILLHEMVHHLQRVSGRYEESSSPCERRNAEELEAYEIQNQFLAMEHDGRTVNLRTLALRCN